MGIIDKLKGTPKWKNADPVVRLEGLREVDDPAVFAEVLDTDADAKVRRALHMAGVRRGHRVLEIGCGWGALIIRAAKKYGAIATGALDYSTGAVIEIGGGFSVQCRAFELQRIGKRHFDSAVNQALCRPCATGRA